MGAGGGVLWQLAAGPSGPILRFAIRSAAVALLALSFPGEVIPRTHSGFPVDVIAGPSPQPVSADARPHLLYELHLTNFASLPIELTRIEVAGDSASALARYDASALQNIGGAWHPVAGETQLIRHGEFPLNNAVVTFP